MAKVRIKTLLGPNAIEPRIAYSSTSAGFDIAASEDTILKAKSSTLVPTDIKLTIPEDENFYMLLMMRSSMGFKKDLQCHHGVIDAGYTGDLGVKLYNLSDKDITIKKGEYFIQALVLEKHKLSFEYLNKDEFEKFAQSQERGANGFGSSDKHSNQKSKKIEKTFGNFVSKAFYKQDNSGIWQELKNNNNKSKTDHSETYDLNIESKITK